MEQITCEGAEGEGSCTASAHRRDVEGGKKSIVFFLPQYSTSPRFPVTFALHHRTQVAEQKQLSDRVCEIVDAPVSFQRDVWKHCGFPLSRRETGGKVRGSQKAIHTSCQCVER